MTDAIGTACALAFAASLVLLLRVAVRIRMLRHRDPSLPALSGPFGRWDVWGSLAREADFWILVLADWPKDRLLRLLLVLLRTVLLLAIASGIAGLVAYAWMIGRAG